MAISSLRDQINQQFNNEELRQLCFDLGIEYENLVGDTRGTRMQSLVEYCLRHGRLTNLITRCQKLRPSASWPDVAALDAEWQKIQQAQPVGGQLAQTANLLSAQVLAAIPPWVQAAWQGAETDTAVQRCLDVGLAAFIHRASAEAPLDVDLRDQVFPQFFQSKPVADQVVHLLEGQPLNRRALQFMATNAGFHPEQFPTLDFDQALQEFEGAFLIRATHEPALQGIIEANQLLQQTQLLTETREILERLVSLLQDVALKDISGISADTITATNVVSGTQNIYQLAPDTAVSHFPSHWESHYLQTLITYCSGLDLTVLAASDTSHDALSIAKVFTTLYLDGLTRAADEAVADVVRPAQVARPESLDKQRTGTRREQGRRPITAVEAAANVSRLVILGQPGGGKSTLVNHIVTQLARQRLGQTQAGLPGWPIGAAPLPVRIVLRRFGEWLMAENRKGEAGDVWDYLEHLLERWGCSDSYSGLRHALIENGGIFFFDGLDEIRGAIVRFSILKGAVANFAKTETKSQVVVTSRPYAYTQQSKWRLPDDQFAVVSLSSLGQDQIASFCQAWYTQVIKDRRGWDSKQCQRRAELLASTIDARPHLRRLAASPLLLTLIAQVDSSGPEAMLPNNRADLYRQMVSLLLARWENRIQLDSHPGHELPEGQILWLEGVPTQEVLDVLAQLAFTGHSQQGQLESLAGSDAPAVEIKYDALKLALVNQFESGSQAEQIITYIQHRTGLLVDKGEGVFTFPHRTYQEYLVAQYLLHQSNGLEQLCANVKAQPDWWQEVFLLSAGSSMTMPKNVQDLVNTLLPFAPGSKEMPLQQDVAAWVIIAAQALWETNFNYHVEREKPYGGFTAVYRRVQTWLQTIMIADDLLPAPVRAEAGRWLARLGDEREGIGIDPETRLPRLKWSQEIPAGEYKIGDDKSEYDDEKPRQIVIENPFRLARYPITNAQFQSFIEAPDRDEPAWWNGLPEGEKEFSEPAFPYANHPRETISWYQAVAFCRWLNDKLQRGLLQDNELDTAGYELQMPHENEWEVAARWPNEDVQDRIYPWGPDFDANKANTEEGGVGQTTAVGMYPSGRNRALELYDMSGNVWEWCRNKYANPDDEDVDQSGSDRVLRGGSWLYDQYFARAAARRYGDPDRRYYDYGFRVVLVGRSPSHLDH